MREDYKKPQLTKMGNVKEMTKFDSTCVCSPLCCPNDNH